MINRKEMSDITGREKADFYLEVGKNAFETSKKIAAITGKGDYKEMLSNTVALILCQHQAGKLLTEEQMEFAEFIAQELYNAAIEI